MSVGAAIRTRRLARKLSQAAVAASAGMDRAHLTRIEGGRWEPRLDTLERIAKALGVTVVDLLRSSARRRGRSAA